MTKLLLTILTVGTDLGIGNAYRLNSTRPTPKASRYMIRQLSIGVIGGLLVAVGGLLAYSELGTAIPYRSPGIESNPLAARYHFRGRTSSFYSRATPGGGPTMQKLSR